VFSSDEDAGGIDDSVGDHNFFDFFSKNFFDEFAEGFVLGFLFFKSLLLFLRVFEIESFFGAVFEFLSVEFF